MLLALVPAALPDGYGDALLPLAAARTWLRVDGGEEDDLIAVLRDIAVDAVERYVNCRLAPVPNMVARFDGFGPRMRLGWGPASTVAVASIAYADAGGGSVEMGAGSWRVGVDGSILPAVGRGWPSAGGDVTVTFTAGYPAGACPPSLIGGVKLMLTTLYQHRDALMSEGLEAAVPAGVVMACRHLRELPGL